MSKHQGYYRYSLSSLLCRILGLIYAVFNYLDRALIQKSCNFRTFNQN